MAISRLDNIENIAGDLTAVNEFFVELRISVPAEDEVEGPQAERVVGQAGASIQVTILQTPDDDSKLNLMKLYTLAACKHQREVRDAFTQWVGRRAGDKVEKPVFSTALIVRNYQQSVQGDGPGGEEQLADGFITLCRASQARSDYGIGAPCIADVEAQKILCTQFKVIFHWYRLRRTYARDPGAGILVQQLVNLRENFADRGPSNLRAPLLLSGQHEPAFCPLPL